MSSTLVICLGDLGRSPRICKAAKDLAMEGYKVCLLGYPHTPVAKEIAANVTVAHIDYNPRSDYVAVQISRVMSLIAHLITHKPYSLILIQNPPSVTVLWILLIYRYILNSILMNILSQYFRTSERCKVIVDCHNYGWTLLEGSKLPMKDFLKPTLERLEEWQMRRADRILTVSKAMREDLIWNRGCAKEKVRVFYDVPDQSASVSFKEDGIEVLRKYAPLCKASCKLRVLTSTSYTPDESVDWLLKSISEIGSDDIELVITGKGPQFENIRNLANRLSINYYQIFVDHEDYYKVLSTAHVGVCLHQSSSGLDLPMKIVDMKQAKIPLILAYHYKTLEDEADGIQLFKTQNDLTNQLKSALKSIPHHHTPPSRGGRGSNDKSLVQCLLS